MSQMRDNIESLIKSGITAYKVAKDTGIPNNTVVRIFSGITEIGKVRFEVIEKLNQYYLEECKMIKVSEIKRVSSEVLEYQLENGDKLVILDKEVREMEESHESKVFESVEEKEYEAILSDAAHSDDTVEVIGFKFVRDPHVKLTMEQL